MDIGMALIRVVVGLTFAAHGAQKVFGWFGGYGLDATGQFFEGLGFQPGRRHAALAGWTEVGSGLLFALGLVTPFAAALIASVMIVAAVTVHVKNGFFGTGGGYEYNLVLGAVAIGVAFAGPGALSVDALAGLPSSGLIWGVAALGIAGLGAAGQLAARSRPARATTPSAA